MRLGTVAALMLVGCAGSKGAPSASGTPGAAATAVDPRIAQAARRTGFEDVQLSPDGQHLAATSLAGGESKLVFLRTQDLAADGGLGLTGTDIVHRFRWASDQRVVIELAKQLGPLDLPVRYGEIYALAVGGTNNRLIFGYRAGEMQTGSHITKSEGVRAWGTVLSVVKSDPDRVLVKADPWDRGPVAVYEVDARTGKSRRVTAGPEDEGWYVADERGAVRLAGAQAGLERRTYVLDREGEGWRRLAGASTSARPVGFSAARNLAYVIDEDAQGPALFSVSPSTGEKTLVVRKAGVEPSRILFDPEDGTVVAVEISAEYPEWVVVDDARPLARVLAALRQRFPGMHPRLTSVTSDGKRAVAKISSDRVPDFYVLAGDDGSVRPLFAERTDVDPATTSSMEAIHIRASDGVPIHGYLTLPRGVPDKDLPLVVMVHGGPQFVRDFWGFNSEAQLFAAYGFAVLQVNFRGSGGFGGKFAQAGAKMWGGRVQDDIIETTRWVIQEGIAAKGRVCIYGGSFGAYSALQSAARAPDLFRCAIGVAGVYDLEKLHEEGDIREHERGRIYLEEVVGTDPAALKAASPAHNADRIQARVLLIHGERDRRAPISHAHAMSEALKAAHKPCETLFIPGEGHGFWDEDNRRTVLTRMIAFLEASLGRPPTP